MAAAPSLAARGRQRLRHRLDWRAASRRSDWSLSSSQRRQEQSRRGGGTAACRANSSCGADVQASPAPLPAVRMSFERGVSLATFRTAAAPRCCAA